MKTRLSPFGATLIMPGCAVASRAEPRKLAASDTARATFEHFVDLLYRRRQVRAAFETCVVAHGYRDHAPGGFGSRSSAMAALGQTLGAGGALVEVLHSVFEGDIGMVHLAVRHGAGAAPSARVEIFRVANGRIVEHWGVAA